MDRKPFTREEQKGIKNIEQQLETELRARKASSPKFKWTNGMDRIYAEVSVGSRCVERNWPHISVQDSCSGVDPAVLQDVEGLIDELISVES